MACSGHLGWHLAPAPRGSAARHSLLSAPSPAPEPPSAIVARGGLGGAEHRCIRKMGKEGGSSPRSSPPGMRSGRSSRHVNSQSSEAEEKQDMDDNELAERNAAFAAFKDELSTEMARQQDRVKQWLEDGLDAEALGSAVHELLNDVTRIAVGFGSILQEADVEASRKKLKTVRRLSMLQVETARTAGEVALGNPSGDHPFFNGTIRQN